MHVANKNITCPSPSNFRFLFFILLNDSKGKISFVPNVTFNKTDSRFALWRTVVLVSFPFLYLSSQVSGFGALPPLLCTAPKLAASSLAEADLRQLCPQQTRGVSSVGTSARIWKSPRQTWFPFEASEFNRKLFSSLAQERSVCYWETGEICQQKYLCLASIYSFIFCPSPCLPAFLKPPTPANEEIQRTAVQPSVKGSFLLSSSSWHCQGSGVQV